MLTVVEGVVVDHSVESPHLVVLDGAPRGTAKLGCPLDGMDQCGVHYLHREHGKQPKVSQVLDDCLPLIGSKRKGDQLSPGICLHVDLEVFVGVSAQVEGGRLNHQVGQEVGLDHVKEGHEVEVFDKVLGQSEVELNEVEDGSKAASTLAHHVQLLSLGKHLLAQHELLVTLHPTKLNLGPNLGSQVLGHHGIQIPGKCGSSHQIVGLHVKGKWLGMLGKLERDIHLDNSLLSAGHRELLAESELCLNLLVNNKVGTVKGGLNIDGESTAGILEDLKHPGGAPP